MIKSFGFFASKGDVVFSYLAVSCDILVSSCKPYVILPNKSSKYIQLNHSWDKENKLLCLVNRKHLHDSWWKKSIYLSFSIIHVWKCLYLKLSCRIIAFSYEVIFAFLSASVQAEICQFHSKISLLQETWLMLHKVDNYYSRISISTVIKAMVIAT